MMRIGRDSVRLSTSSAQDLPQRQQQQAENQAEKEIRHERSDVHGDGRHIWVPIPDLGPDCRIDEADHSRKAMLTSINVTTAITRTPIPSAAICGVMADKKSMTAKPTCQDCLRNSPRLRARSDFRRRFYNAGSVSSQGFAWEDCYDWQRR